MIPYKHTLQIYGELSSGIVMKVSTGLAKELLRADCAVLNALAK